MPHNLNAFAGGSSSDESDEDQDDFLYPSRNPGDDEFADYNPRKRRKTGRDPKESAALGIFGSESEDDGRAQRWKSKTMRSKGMSFVKPGQKMNSSDDDVDDEEAEDDRDTLNVLGGPESGPEDRDIDMEDTEDPEHSEEGRPGLGAMDPERPGIGPKMAGRPGGLGWQSSSLPNSGVENKQLGTSSPFGHGFVPSSLQGPILRADLVNESTVPRAAMPSAFSTPTVGKYGQRAKGDSGPSVNAGSFAARMMAKMGYKEGQGLGKDGQGRSGVIEVQLRPQGVGLGAVKEKSKQEKDEERRQAAQRGEILEDSEEEAKKRRRKARVSTGGSGMNTPKRLPKPKYQSLPELQKQAPGLDIPEAFKPILDLTGPGQKLLTSSSGLLTPTRQNESTEVQEARKLARRAQSDLSAFVEEWKNLEERKAWLRLELSQQQQVIEEQENASNQMKSIANTVGGLTEACKDNQWDPVIEILSKVELLRISENDDLATVAVAAIHPFFRQAAEGWLPLEDPKMSGIAADGFATALSSIRDVLGVHDQKSVTTITNGSHKSRQHKASPFESMMYTLWLPKVRSSITNNWDVHDPAPLQTLLDIWEDLLPGFVRSQIFDHLVVRKLDEAVAAWNPKKRHNNPLPHLWLFPWLQYLPSHHADPKSASGLVSDVKRKFRSLIDSWDFKRGTIPGLRQWQSVLCQTAGNDQWTPLILNHVLPALARYLRVNFRVAPQDQEPFMQYLENVLKWHEIIGSRMMGQLLADEMFPMWQDVLHQWLTLDSVNYAEIGEWFDFWHLVIPESINEVPAVKAEWKRGSDMINQALDLGRDAKERLPAPIKSDKRAEVSKPVPVAAPAPAPVPEAPEVTFRHQVEDWCLARELQFIPEKSTLEAAGPVYRITAAPIGKGGVLVYFKGNDIYAQIKRGEWTRLGREMDALYELAHR